MKTTANGTTAAKVNTGNEIVNATAAAYLRGTEPVREESTGRECYAFGLYVGGELTRFVTAECWLTRKEAEDYASGMSLCAHAFRRTASICVYKLENNDVWQLYTTRNHGTSERTIYKIHRSRLKGCEFVKPTQEEERAFLELKEWHRLPFQDVAALPTGWNEPESTAAEWCKVGARVQVYDQPGTAYTIAEIITETTGSGLPFVRLDRAWSKYNDGQPRDRINAADLEPLAA